MKKLRINSREYNVHAGLGKLFKFEHVKRFFPYLSGRFNKN